MKVFVTGGAGFIGSHLIDKLVADGHEVTVYDNLSSGELDFLRPHLGSIQFVKGDLTTDLDLGEYLADAESIFHLAADPDVRAGFSDPSHQLEHNLVGTFNLLEAMKDCGARSITFTSTSTVYGNADMIPTSEDYGPLLPISIYGATKLAGEGLISSYADNYGFDAVLWRFANVVGPRSTHGVIFDFVRKLRENSNEMEILGDGKQRKSYFYIDDCIDAMIHSWKNADGVNVYNIGSEDTIDVTTLADIVVDVLGLGEVTYNYTGGIGGAGWKGDVKYMQLDVQKMIGLGWEPKFDSSGAVRETVKHMLTDE